MKASLIKKFEKQSVSIELDLEEADLIRIGLSMFLQQWAESEGYSTEVRICSSLEQRLVDIL